MLALEITWTGWLLLPMVFPKVSLRELDFEGWSSEGCVPGFEVSTWSFVVGSAVTEPLPSLLPSPLSLLVPIAEAEPEPEAGLGLGLGLGLGAAVTPPPPSATPFPDA